MKKIILIVILNLLTVACGDWGGRPGPRIESTPPTDAQVGVLYQYQLSVSHSEGLDVSVSLETSPDGMTLDNDTFLISWMPTAPDDYVPIKIYARDDEGRLAKQGFYITVLPADNNLPTISAQLENLREVSEGAYEQIIVGGDSLSISGTYTNATGLVEVVAQNGDQSLSTSSTNGSFQLQLPFTTSGEQWSIGVYEQANPANRIDLMLTLTTDATVPVVTLSENTANTDTDIYKLQGTVTDDSGELRAVIATSSRFDGTEFAVFITAQGQINADIPLLAGDNRITVIATDVSGNRGQGQISVIRDIGEAPVINITAPVAGAVTDAEFVDISGVLYTSLPASDIRIRLGGDILFPETDQADGAYDFTFNQRPLAEGLNTFTVTAETTAGAESATVSITRRAQQDNVAPPQLTITSPESPSFTQGDGVFISGYISGSALPLALTANGVAVSLLGDSSLQNFSTLVGLPTADGEHLITLRATDSTGQSATRILRIIRDTTPPQVEIDDANLQPEPAVNAVTQLPYPLSGLVTEQNLASLTINGQSLSLLPTANVDQLSFATSLSLPVGTDTLLAILARDRAGNQSTLQYLLNANPEALIDLISPAPDASFALSSMDATIPVLARLSNTQAGISATLSLDGATVIPAAIQDSVINTEIPIDLAQNEHNLVLSIFDSNNQVVARTERRFTTENLDNAPLKVRVEPGNAAVNINPNDSIRLYFNRPIDSGLLELDIRESVNGLTIVVERERNPSDFPSVSNAEPVAVNRVQEVVPGRSGLLPGNTVVLFHPSRIFAYGAEVFVTVRYDGELLSRSSFKVRPIPTFLQANVVDQQGQALKGIPVEIPDLGLQTTTTTDGSFSFGFGLPPERQLSGGQVKLVFNRGNQVANFGEVSKFVYLETGHLNRVGTTQVPLLASNIAYRAIASNQSEAVLASGELQLDLSQARLLFPNGRNQGSVHVQFTPGQALSHGSLRSAMPQWLFALQPAGIEVNGTLGVTIKVPALSGGYDYLVTDRFYVLMVGLDPDTLTIVPTGVGLMENKIVTATLTQQQSLDYIGYAMVVIDQQILEDAYEGRLSLEELIMELEQAL